MAKSGTSGTGKAISSSKPAVKHIVKSMQLKKRAAPNVKTQSSTLQQPNLAVDAVVKSIHMGCLSML